MLSSGLLGENLHPADGLARQSVSFLVGVSSGLHSAGGSALMFRRVVCALFVLGVAVGITLSAEMRGVITKVEGNKITFAEMKGKEKSPEKTYTVADNVKVFKGKFNKDTKKVEVGDAIPGGLKAEPFSKISEKG